MIDSTPDESTAVPSLAKFAKPVERGCDLIFYGLWAKGAKMDLHSSAKVDLSGGDVNRFLDRSAKLTILTWFLSACPG
jgi:hypothetical protein